MSAAAPDAAAIGAEVVRAGDPERFAAALFAPAARRPDLLALHAFDVEIAKIPLLVTQPLAGEIRLQWWREAIGGGRAEEAAANPVAAALLAAITRARLPVAAFDNYLAARLRDLYDDPLATVTDLEGYGGDTASAMVRLAALILADGGDPGSADAAGHAGIALAIPHLLDDIGRGRGVQFVPTEILARHGARRDDLLARRLTPALAVSFAELRALALRHLAAVRASWPGVAPPTRAAFLPLATVEPRLRRLARRPFGSTPPALWRRQAALYWAARRGRV